MDKKVWTIIIQGAFIALTVVIIGIMLVKRFVYFRPSSHFVNTIEPYTVIRQKHLYAWFLEGTNGKIILFCHGNAGNVSNRESKVSALNKLGYSVLIFDYSGYGKSEGVPTEQNCYDDTSIMTAYLRQSYDPQDIILYGESLGAPIATYIARRYSIPTLILESPLPSVKKVIQSRYSLIGFLSFLFPEFDTVKYLRGFPGKSLVLHSVDDEMIPYQTVEELISVSTKHIQMRGSHNTPNIPWEQVTQFIET